MVAELSAAGAFLLVALAEVLHQSRLRRIGPLAFGPTARPRGWALTAPLLRAGACAAVAWGLVTLLVIAPKVHKAQVLEDKERKHIILVLDVSPSMRLADAGVDLKKPRNKRAAELMASFFERVPVERYKVSVIATYNGSKPVVKDTTDLEVVRNILDDLPLSQAFEAGKTDIFSGLQLAADLARPWNPKSTLVMLVSDGDTVSTTGMPKMPAAVSDVLIVGVGDPKAGAFIEGRQSRQDASTLRQVATRLNGAYHDGNAKHLPTKLLAELTGIADESPFSKLTRREYALIAISLGAATLAVLPVLLHAFGTSWRPGVPELRRGRAIVTRSTGRVPRQVGVG